MNLSTWISFGYAWFSVFVYFLICRIILRNRKIFHSSYYKLFLVSSAINILTYVNSLFTLRYPIVCCRDCFLSFVYAQGHFFGLEALIMGLQYFGLAQYGISVAVAANRLTTVTLTFTYDKLWNRIFLPIVVIVLLLPAILTFPHLLYPSQFIYYDSVDRFSPQTDYSSKSSSLVGLLFQGSCTIICLILNLATAFLVFRKKPTYSNKNSSTELRLFFHSLLNFAAELFAATLIGIIYFYPSDSETSKTALSLISYCSDALTFVSPYILLLCSSDLRNEMLCRKKRASSIVVSPSPSQPSRAASTKN